MKLSSMILAVLGVVSIGNAKADELATETANPFDWSGFHIGAYAAYGYGDTQSNDGANSHPKDPFLGVFGGYAADFDGFTLGVEGDLSLSDLDGDTGSGPGFVSQDVDNIASIRGRVGIPFDSVQFFASAGWAWADSERATFTDRDHKMLNGPMLGIGVQHAISDHLSARFELDYYNYGKVEYDMPGSPEVDSNIAVVKIGVDYYL
jgi:outer membrane immunogenic protein